MKQTDNIKTIFEKVYIETPVDTDGDGHYDLIAAWITRPESTLNGSDRVPVVFVANPYLMTCNEEWYNLHDVDVELKSFPTQDITLEAIQKQYEHEPKYHAEKTEIKGSASHAITEETPVFEAISPLYSYLAQKGYAIVYSGGLGTMGSDGFTMTGSREEVLAFEAVIHWLCGRAKGFTDRGHGIEVKADWCNHKIAMSAKSYLGTLQYALAAKGVDGLKAIIPEAGICNWYDYYRANGLCLCPMEWQGDDCNLLSLYCMSRAKTKDDWDKIEESYNKLMDKYIELEERDSGNYNSFWDERNYLAHGEKYDVPTFIIHGINDWNVKTSHCANAFSFLENKGIDRKLLLHQGGHIYVYDLQGCEALELIEKWLARYLKDEKNGVEDTPKVLVQSNVDQLKWYYSDAWPPKDVEYFTFPINRQEGRYTIVDDLDKTVFNRDDNNLIQWRDQLVMGEGLSNGRFFAQWNPWDETTSDKEFIRISGTVKISFSAAINRTTGILSCMLVDMGKSNRLTDEQIKTPTKDNPDLFKFGVEEEPSEYKVISRGWMNAQNLENIWSKTELIAGEEYAFNFDMVPTDHTLAKGHRLGLIIYGIDPEFTIKPKAVTEITIDTSTIDVKVPMII